MKGHRLFIRSIGIVLLAWMPGCADFLNQDPQSTISREEALNSIFDVQLAVTGSYNRVITTNYYAKFMMIYGDLAGEIVKPGVDIQAADQADYLPLYNLDMRAIEVGFSRQAYPEIYRVLYAVNNIIAAVPNLPDGTEAERNTALGEALAIRALAHFDLLRLYSQAYFFTPDASHTGVVIITRPIKPDERLRRGTVEAGYAQVIDDLEQAIDLLPVSTNRIRFTKTSARALLARVMLYTGNWSRAATLAGEVIADNITLATNAEYTTIWANGYRTKEYVLRFDSEQFVQNTLSTEWSPANVVPALSLSQDIAQLYSETDIRKALIIEDSQGNLLTGKYPFTVNRANDIPVFRLAEAYLIRAEAYARLDRPELARADLNIIRKRADPAAPDVTSSGDDLLDAILLERKKEFAFE